MDLTTIALIALVWKMATGLGGKSNKSSPVSLDSLSGLLSDDTKSVLSSAQTLIDSSASSEDKTGAVLNLVSNPAVINVVQQAFGGGQKSAPANDEGYVFPARSEESQSFFRPIDQVCGTEVKDRLCWLYDNHYVKK